MSQTAGASAQTETHAHIQKILKIGGALLAVILLLGGLFLAHTWYFKPVNINLFFGRTMMQIMTESPELLSTLRLLEPFGIKGHNATGR